MKLSALFTTIMLLLASFNCTGENNLFDCWHGFKKIKCDKPTQDEIAFNALNDGNYTEAINILRDLVQNEPDNYSRYPRLAAAYAARGGIDILGLARASLSGGGDMMSTFQKFLPTPASVGATQFQLNLTDVNDAILALHQIPAAILADTKSDPYAASAVMQLTLYQSSYAIMYLEQFAISPTTGNFSIDQLASMTPDQAEQVLANLLAVGNLPQNSSNDQVQAIVAATIKTINDEPGATTKDKIAAFVAAQPGVEGGLNTSNGAGT